MSMEERCKLPKWSSGESLATWRCRTFLCDRYVCSVLRDRCVVCQCPVCNLDERLDGSRCHLVRR